VPAGSRGRHALPSLPPHVAEVGLEYTLTVELAGASDGARLWLNGTLLLDTGRRGRRRPSGRMRLPARALSALTLEYTHIAGPAGVRLLWSNALLPTQPVPTEHLFSVTPAGAPQPSPRRAPAEPGAGAAAGD
jgi:hypothetical protein